ncbi:MAG: hypothetical protein SNJ77_00990 [Cytophagales bacterium]
MQKNRFKKLLSFMSLGALLSVICFASPVCNSFSKKDSEKTEVKASVNHEAVMTGLEVKLNGNHVALLPEVETAFFTTILNSTKLFSQQFFIELGHWFINIKHHIIVKRGP